MEINLKEGVFLGKQEMERLLLLNRSYSDTIATFLGHTESGGFSRYGLFGHDIISIVRDDVLGGWKFVVDSTNAPSDSLNNLGRLVVGINGSGSRIGVVSSKDFTGKECFLSSGSLSADGVICLSAAKTNYENALISIGASGSGLVTKGWSFVKNSFRNALSGRPTKIKTESGQVLSVLSIRNNVIQFNGTSFVEETNVRFMFLQTIGPFETDSNSALYLYDTCSISVEPLLSTGLESTVNNLYSGGTKIPLASYNSSTNTVTMLSGHERERTFDFIGALSDFSVGSRHIANGAVTSRHIANGSVASSKLATNAVDTSNLKDSSVTLAKLGSTCFGFSEYVNGTLGPSQISSIVSVSDKISLTNNGFSSEDSVRMPARVLIKNGLSNSLLMQSFFSYPTGNIVFPYQSSAETYNPDYYYIVDIYWISTNTVLIEWRKV